MESPPGIPADSPASPRLRAADAVVKDADSAGSEDNVADDNVAHDR